MSQKSTRAFAFSTLLSPTSSLRKTTDLRSLIAILVIAWFFVRIDCPLSSAEQSDQRPNVLLIMADDLGYSDLGCFGSEIQTPHIDRIAKDGLQFSHFRATPMCVTSRISLMAGMPMHRAGAHNYSHSIPLALLMKQSGYRTMMTGKWHGGSPDPRSRELFDRSFGFLGGATDSFIGGDDWFLDGQPFNEFGSDFYATDAFADRSIEFMAEAARHREPFFLYVALNAPHHPCQAPKETVAKYQSLYQRGYESVREERRRRQETIGLVDPDWRPARIENEVRRWHELSPHRQKIEAGRMAAYAAAVDEVDQAVGRMLAHLDQARIADNTLVVFLSDNGGDYSNGSITTDEQQIPWQPKSNPSSSNGWASVKCTPFRYYKHACHEGGIATPLVLRWPDGMKRQSGDIVDTPVSITDIYPTLLELAGVEYPKKFKGRIVRRPTGRSILPLLESDAERSSGPNVAGPNFQWYAFSRAWIQDEWKAVSLYDGPWQLFDLRRDRCESQDLATQHPDRLSKFVKSWQEFARESDVPDATRRVSDFQQHWGWHRIKMALPGIQAVWPANGVTTDSTTVKLRLEFDDEIDFAETEGSKIYLYDVSDESQPIWQSDPSETHPSQGRRTIDFSDIPDLAPDHHYAIRCDAGWAKIGNRRSGTLNDGAFWWRFRTPKLSPDPQ